MGILARLGAPRSDLVNLCSEGRVAARSPVGAGMGALPGAGGGAGARGGARGDGGGRGVTVKDGRGLQLGRSHLLGQRFAAQLKKQKRV